MLTIAAPMTAWRIRGTARLTAYCTAQPYPAQPIQKAMSGYHVLRVRAYSRGKSINSIGFLGFL
jgi:hypothetical protein